MPGLPRPPKRGGLRTALFFLRPRPVFVCSSASRLSLFVRVPSSPSAGVHLLRSRPVLSVCRRSFFFVRVPSAPVDEVLSSSFSSRPARSSIPFSLPSRSLRHPAALSLPSLPSLRRPPPRDTDVGAASSVSRKVSARKPPFLPRDTDETVKPSVSRRRNKIKPPRPATPFPCTIFAVLCNKHFNCGKRLRRKICEKESVRTNNKKCHERNHSFFPRLPRRSHVSK